LDFDYLNISLPVKEVIPHIKKELTDSCTLILKAPTGAGKSTLVPLTLLDEPWLKGKKILMLEPRRLAAKTVAIRMADLLAESIGETIGYKIRFENKTSKNTRLEVLTEGILTRMIQEDNSLEDIGLVIFDEFHERSIHADLAMALCRETQSILRPDLRILVMSATLDMPKLSEMLQAPIVESKGRLFPVEIEYSGDADAKMLPELMSRIIKKAVEKNDGDVLAFLPGQGEIKKCEGILQNSLKGFEIHPLYGQLSPNKQFAAITPSKSGKRKIVLATNIAETSLTIEGVKIVVDSGFERVSKFNPNSGLSSLETAHISKQSADQRKGRAGRLSAGICYRMWTIATHTRLPETGTPEIEQADLSSLMLDMAKWGIIDPNELSWLSLPPQKNVIKANQLLHEIDALENNRITDHGKRLHKLPTHPRIAHMLVRAEEEGQLALATDIAPLFEEKDPLPQEPAIDINIRIEALRRFRRDKNGPKALGRIEKLASQYRKLFNIETDNGPVNDFETGLLIATAYPERIACARPGNNAQFQMANGKLASAGHRDDLAHEPWLAVANVSERDHSGKIFSASPINPKDLAPLIKHKETITWNTKSGGLVAESQMRIGNIILKTTPLPNPDPTALAKAISDAIEKQGGSLLDWNEDVTQWQNRIISLKKWNPQQKWPNVQMSTLLLTNSEWLAPYLVGIRKPADLKKLNLFEILEYSIPQDLQETLKNFAPQKVKLPNGTFAKLEYQENASPPVLAVPLQRCFGMLTTPTVNNGKVNVLMHLLSPGYKIVQVTSDLESFWSGTYFEIRKELKIRYHKHAWPENPTVQKVD
jgi:ATP-dependent helicase HrpB